MTGRAHCACATACDAASCSVAAATLSLGSPTVLFMCVCVRYLPHGTALCARRQSAPGLGSSSSRAPMSPMSRSSS